MTPGDEHEGDRDNWADDIAGEVTQSPPVKDDRGISYETEIGQGILNESTAPPVAADAPPISPWIVLDPMTVLDDSLQVRRRDGRKFTLLLGVNNPIREIPPGWVPVLLYEGLEPLLLLELEHAQWGRATWYLTSEGHKIGDRVTDLPPDYRAQLRTAVINLFLDDADPETVKRAIGFWMLNGVARSDTIRFSFNDGEEE